MLLATKPFDPEVFPPAQPNVPKKRIALRAIPADTHNGLAPVKTELTRLERVIRLLLVVDPTSSVRWSAIRRSLLLCGVVRTERRIRSPRGSLRDAVLSAIVGHAPDARLVRTSRKDAAGRGTRVVRGVRLAINPERINKAREVVGADWEARLGAEGLQEIKGLKTDLVTPLDTVAGERSRIAELVQALHARREIDGFLYEKAQEYLHANSWDWRFPGHKRIWSKFCTGATHEEIAEETGIPESTVQKILMLHRVRAGMGRG